MSTEFFVHIGLHKTGSTYLQRYFDFHRKWLQDHGILFPRTGISSPDAGASEHSFRGHAKLFKIFRDPSSREADTLLGELRSEIVASGLGKVLLSSETFSAPDRQVACAQGLTLLLNPSDTVRVIVYLRRQDRWLESFYREILGWKRKRETRDIEQFSREERSTFLDFSARLRPWIEAVGADYMVVRSYDDVVAGAGLLADVLECLEIQSAPPADEQGDAVIHRSLDPSLVDLLRAINTLELSPKRKANITRLLRSAKIDTSNGSLIRDDLWLDMKREYAEENERLAGEFMSGPHAEFFFPEVRPATPVVQQRLDFDTALAFVNALLNKAAETEAYEDSAPL